MRSFNTVITAATVVPTFSFPPSYLLLLPHIIVFMLFVISSLGISLYILGVHFFKYTLSLRHFC
jgi:hypothetical protein